MVESGQILETCVGNCPKDLGEIVAETIAVIAVELLLAVIVVAVMMTALYVWKNRKKRRTD